MVGIAMPTPAPHKIVFAPPAGRGAGLGAAGDGGAAAVEGLGPESGLPQ